MRKLLYFFISIFLLAACSSQNKKKTSTFLSGFSTYYNTLFNSKDALESEINSRKTSFKENYYTPYIPLLKYDQLPLGTEVDELESFSNSQNNAPGKPGGQSQTKGATTLQIAEAKALKAISKYSVMKNGEEKNKTLFDAYILLAQSRLYMGKPVDALDALNNIFTNMPKDKRLPLAKIYQAEAYTKMGDFYKADEIFSGLKQTPKLKKAYKRLASIFYSEMLLAYGKKDKAVDELNLAFKLNKNRELRSRISFLKGQILASMDRKDEARESFAKAYKYANDFEFEVKSQIEIAKTFDNKRDDYEGAKRYLEKISKKGAYLSRKNEFYYALGLLANNANKPEEADEFFKKSLKEKVSDPQIRGLDYYEIGKSFFNKSDYLSAGAYYDSALATMTYEPSKVLLQEQTQNIKKVVKNYYLVKKNDSILALAKMSEPEKVAYFTKIIDKMKTKEMAEELDKKRQERNKGFDTGDYSANSIFGSSKSGFQDFSGGNSGGSSFYFANQNTVSKGTATFKQIWGNRQLADNWRTSAQSTSLGDLKNQAMGITSAPDPRRHDPQFYIEKIPTDPTVLLQLKKDRDTASLGLGRMYNEFFDDTQLATKTLNNLLEVKPEEEVELQALYLLFVMNYEKNPAEAEKAKQVILRDFPYTSYAEYVKNPKNNSFIQSSEEVLKAYNDAYDLYEKEKYDESKTLIDEALKKYPKDALVPKFALLYAFNTGKTAGKEVMILQLEQIVLNYPKTQEGIKAKEMLKYLKSDLKVESTDQEGNPIPPTSPSPPPIENTQPEHINNAPASPGTLDEIKEKQLKEAEAKSLQPEGNQQQKRRRN